MRSGPEAFDSDDVRALAEAQQEEMRGRYAGEADIGPTREASMFVEPDGVFLVVRDEDGRAVACGGIARFDDARAELKRMYVVPERRGLGLGRRCFLNSRRKGAASAKAGMLLRRGTASRKGFGFSSRLAKGAFPCYR